jgi:hypothetical protein
MYNVNNSKIIKKGYIAGCGKLLLIKLLLKNTSIYRCFLLKESKEHILACL